MDPFSAGSTASYFAELSVVPTAECSVDSGVDCSATSTDDSFANTTANSTADYTNESSIDSAVDTSEYSAFNTFRRPMYTSICELDAIITMVNLQQFHMKDNYYKRPLAVNSYAIQMNRTYLKAIYLLKRITKKNLEEGTNNVYDLNRAVDYAEAVYKEYKDAKEEIIFG